MKDRKNWSELGNGLNGLTFAYSACVYKYDFSVYIYECYMRLEHGNASVIETTKETGLALHMVTKLAFVYLLFTYD